MIQKLKPKDLDFLQRTISQCTLRKEETCMKMKVLSSPRSIQKKHIIVF